MDKTPPTLRTTTTTADGNAAVVAFLRECAAGRDSAQLDEYLAGRILDALAEKTAECERVNEWGAGERTKFLKAYDEARLLRAQLAAAQADSRRLDWLEAQTGNLFTPNDIAADTATGWRWYGVHHTRGELAVKGDTVRAVLDHAMTQGEK